MAWIRRVRTASGATAVQIAEYVSGRRQIVAHVGSAHTEAELGILLEQARLLLVDAGRGELDLGVVPTPVKADLVAPPVVEAALFGDDAVPVGQRARVSSARVVGTFSRLLFDTLAGVYDDLGFGAAVGDETFRDLVIARIVEPTSILDMNRVLGELGQMAASEKTMRRTLTRCAERGYRDQIASACFAHTLTAGDVSLCLYDVTTLYFEAENEDALRKVGFSKERRVDPQIVVGLLSTGAVSPSRSAAMRETRPRPRPSSRSSSSSPNATTWPTWSWSLMPGCCLLPTSRSSTRPACGSSWVLG